LLIPFIPKSVRIVWECAAGEKKIANVLSEYDYNVLSSDIRDNLLVSKLNFLTEKCSLNCESREVAIITNPPYSLKRQFFNKCIELNATFALLISGDYSLWTIDAVRKYSCEKIVPDHRINFITPTGLSEATGHLSYFHSYWLTRYFGLGKSETFVELTKKMRKNI
jgi:hypothetical protein